MTNFFLSIITFLITGTCIAQKDLINLEYGKHPQQTLDLFLPAHYSGSTPVVIMVHGGAWVMGGKDYTDKRAKDLRDRGFVVANIDYRYVSETVHCNNLLEDLDNAVAYVLSEGKKYNYNTKQFHIAGISAGAHLSLLYGYTTKRHVQSITAICPPTILNERALEHLKRTNLTQNVEFLADAKFTDGPQQDKRFNEISPVAKITNIPTLLIHGDSDQLVPYWNSTQMLTALKERKIDAKLLTMKGKDHDAGLNDSVTETQAYDVIVKWINSHN